MNLISCGRVWTLCCSLSMLGLVAPVNAETAAGAANSLEIAWPSNFDLYHIDVSVTNRGAGPIEVCPLMRASKRLYEGPIPYNPSLSIGIDSDEDPREVNIRIFFLCGFAAIPSPTTSNPVFGEQELPIRGRLPANIEIAPGETKRVHLYAGNEGELSRFAVGATEARCCFYGMNVELVKARLANTDDGWKRVEQTDPFKALNLDRGIEDIFAGEASTGPYIDSVAQGQDSVLASTSDGLYQASLKDKIWRKLPTPPSMPVAGALVQQGPSSPVVVCYPNRWTNKGPAGLFVSKDFGKTWEHVSPQRDFRKVFVHPNGSIYAFEKLGDSSAATNRLIVSQDLGKTWRIIKPNLGGDAVYWLLFQDPDHPDLVCYAQETFSLHSWIETYQADDEAYRNWKQTTRYLDVGGGTKSEALLLKEEPLFAPIFIGQGHDRILASLSNFFDLPFMKWGNDVAVSPVQIETEKPSFTFHPHESMPILVQVKLIGARPGSQPRLPFRFADIQDETVFWGLRVLPENNDAAVAFPKILGTARTRLEDREEQEARLLHDPALKVISLDEDHPYSREIDLSKFYDFSKPGSYRAQFFQMDAKWGGTFAGQVFEVSITQ